MVPLGLWNDMRLPSFFSGVFFWPVSESKRGKVRITFMFLSPPACHKLPFPSPVGRQLIRQQWASQPASDVSCERRTSFSPSLSLSLPVLLALLLPCCPSSAFITLSSLSLSSSSSSSTPCGAMTAAVTGSPCPPPPVASHSVERPRWPPSRRCCYRREPERRRGGWLRQGSRRVLKLEMGGENSRG